MTNVPMCCPFATPVLLKSMPICAEPPGATIRLVCDTMSHSNPVALSGLMGSPTVVAFARSPTPSQGESSSSAAPSGAAIRDVTGPGAGAGVAARSATILVGCGRRRTRIRIPVLLPLFGIPPSAASGAGPCCDGNRDLAVSFAGPAMDADSTVEWGKDGLAGVSLEGGVGRPGAGLADAAFAVGIGRSGAIDGGGAGSWMDGIDRFSLTSRLSQVMSPVEAATFKSQSNASTR